MSNIRTQYNYGFQICRDEKTNSHNAGAFYSQAIENADGVPFKLIFGPQPGEGSYPYVGTGITKLLGVAPEDFTEKVFNSMIEEIVPLSEDISIDLSESRRKFISGEIKSYKAEILLRTALGERKWIRDASLPLIDEETGKVAGAFGILYDITGSKLNPDRIKEKEDEYERLKSALIHNISHEIRTPLNAIVGFSTLLGEHMDIPERRKEYLDIIISNSDHLLEIIDDIVEISKIDAKIIKIRKDKVNLNWVLLKVYEQFWAEAFAKGVQLSFAPAHDTGEADVYTDCFKLTEVLRNLVENALKFTYEGKVKFGYSVEEGKIEFYVSDTGIGVPVEQQERIFSRFFQGDSSSTRIYGGTGMGLSITKAYVELLGGEIWFTSQPGEGSDFRFTVPYERVEE